MSFKGMWTNSQTMKRIIAPQSAIVRQVLLVYCIREMSKQLTYIRIDRVQDNKLTL